MSGESAICDHPGIQGGTARLFTDVVRVGWRTVTSEVEPGEGSEGGPNHKTYNKKWGFDSLVVTIHVRQAG